MNATTSKQQAKIDAAIANADEVRRLTPDEMRALPGILARVVPAMVTMEGFYSFTDARTSRKVCIVLR